MLILILFLLIGSVLAYVSQNNLTPVAVRIGPYIFEGIPLFYVIIGSILTGLILAYLIHLVGAISTAFKIKGKEKKISEQKKDVLSLTKRVHQLELENERLKHEPIDEQMDDKAL